MSNTMPKITVEKSWTPSRVRAACINNNLYTDGSATDYYAMLDMVGCFEPTTENIFLVASDIKEHSECQTVSNIMFILNAEAVITSYDIEGEKN